MVNDDLAERLAGRAHSTQLRHLTLFGGWSRPRGLSGRRILAITSAFQADEAGSIPAARSNIFQLSSTIHCRIAGAQLDQGQADSANKQN